MKYLLLLLVIVVVLLLMRQGGASRRNQTPRSANKQAREDAPQAMVACAHCGVHLPRNDALAGPRGVFYCSEPHRRLHEPPREGAA